MPVLGSLVCEWLCCLATIQPANHAYSYLFTNHTYLGHLACMFVLFL
jgi:hypothetical protein